MWKKSSADLGNGRVNLDAIDGNRAVDGRQLARNRAGRETDDGDTLELRRSVALVEVGGDGEVVPLAVGENLVGIVDGVNGIAFVQHQVAVVARLHDLDVVVGGFRFVDKLAALGSPHDAAGYEQHEQCDDEHQYAVQPGLSTLRRTRADERRNHQAEGEGQE